MDQNQNSSTPHKGSLTNPAYNIDVKDSSEHLRSVLLIVSAVIGGCILLFYIFGQEWLRSVMEKADGGYVQIIVAIFLTLFALTIISGIFRSIFKAASFATGSSTDTKLKDPTFRIISGVIFLILAFFLFNYILTFLSQNQFFGEIEKYLEKGIQIETEEGDKMIKLESGELKIEDVLPE